MLICVSYAYSRCRHPFVTARRNSVSGLSAMLLVNFLSLNVSSIALMLVAGFVSLALFKVKGGKAE